MYRSVQSIKDGNFLLLRPYHGEHGPKVPVTPEYIVLQWVLRKRECMSIPLKIICVFGDTAGILHVPDPSSMVAKIPLYVSSFRFSLLQLNITCRSSFCIMKCISTGRLRDQAMAGRCTNGLAAQYIQEHTVVDTVIRLILYAQLTDR
jgi:hypothetical protein